MTEQITRKQYDIFYKSLDDKPGKDKKVKRISRESDTSLSHTYRCLKELKRHGNVLQTWKRPKQFIRVGRLPEPGYTKKEMNITIRNFLLKLSFKKKQAAIPIMLKYNYPKKEVSIGDGKKLLKELKQL